MLNRCQIVMCSLLTVSVCQKLDQVELNYDVKTTKTVGKAHLQLNEGRVEGTIQGRFFRVICFKTLKLRS